MPSGLAQPTGNKASLIELEHIWRDTAHPADSDTALSSLHFPLRIKSHEAEVMYEKLRNEMPITFKVHAVCQLLSFT